MNQNGTDFIRWATDPARTLEERYGIVRIVEVVYQEHYRGEDRKVPDWEAQRQMRRRRMYNPAYKPDIEEPRLHTAAALLDGVTSLRFDSFQEDRPLRDLSFLAFLPQLEQLELGGMEIEDIAPVARLAKLRTLSIRCDEIEDYGPLASCRELRRLTIHSAHPWPVIGALAGLPHLEELFWQGNGRALDEIPALPALRALHLESSFYDARPAVSFRDLRQLPEMPRLEYLWAGWFHRLDGIERYPALRFLGIRGRFRQLDGLETLTSLTHLRVTAPLLEGVERLLSMPGVLHFALCGERPQDWGVLMQSETLREVFHFGYDGDQPDLETLRMLLPPWDDHFASPEPRPLAPLRLLVRGDEGDKGIRNHSHRGEYPDGPAGWHGNHAMRQSERWWAESRLRDALRDAGHLRLPGLRFRPQAVDVFQLFSTEPSAHLTRMLHITVLKSEAIGRLPGIIACIRSFLAGTRFPWLVEFMVDPEPGSDAWDESWRSEPVLTYAQEMEQLEREREHKHRCRQILLADQHRLRMLEELGEDTSGFRPTPLPPPPGEPDFDAEDPADDEPDADDDSEGGTSFFDPEKAALDESWLPAVDVGDPARDWTHLRCMFTLTEAGIHMHIHNQGIPGISELLDVVPERVDD